MPETLPKEINDDFLENRTEVDEITMEEEQNKVSNVEPLEETDPILIEVRAALDMDFAGVILVGPPGTGKSRYAKRLALNLSGNMELVRIVQFHPSYQYEDFMMGYAPTPGGGFALEKKVFARLCEDATNNPNATHILLIDEISRCDVARVFGEALTYLEPDKRGQEFLLASGSSITVPPNLAILATMNPWDKGVDELDMALERRFAEIEVAPSENSLRQMLEDKGAALDHVDRVARLFSAIQRDPNELVRVGHAYFSACVDEEKTRRAWRLRLMPTFKKACRLDAAALKRIEGIWVRMFPSETQIQPKPAPEERAAAEFRVQEDGPRPPEEQS